MPFVLIGGHLLLLLSLCSKGAQMGRLDMEACRAHYLQHLPRVAIASVVLDTQVMECAAMVLIWALHRHGTAVLAGTVHSLQFLLSARI